MDVMNTPHCVPHPLAVNVLFKHKREALNVFSDVIGLCEIDHLSIACINAREEIVFLSHTPAIEYSLMTSNLWPSDGTHAPQFYKQTSRKQWTELFHVDKYFELMETKQIKHGLVAGFSIPMKHDDCYLIYSFATRTADINPSQFFLEKQQELIGIGHYCFNQLSDILLLHTVNQKPVVTKKTHHHLKLVVNNQMPTHHHSEILELS